MAYVVPRPSGRWELRRAITTPAGPRSRTLIGFRSLGPADVAKAVERSGGLLDKRSVRAAARRAGAPVESEPAVAAAARLVAAIDRGEELPQAWRGIVVAALDGAGAAPASDAQRAAAPWADRPLEERGRALEELMLLAERTGHRGRPAQLEFPPLTSP